MRNAMWICSPWLAFLVGAALDAADCNQNGMSDLEETLDGIVPDCNENGVPDPCDVLPRNFGFARGPWIHTDVASGDLASGDVDGDGDEDIVAMGYSGFEVLLQDGNGAFPERYAFGSGEPTWSSFILEDLDSDGAQEVLAQRSNASSIEIYRFRGAVEGPFPRVAILQPMAPYTRFVTADIDADGDRDILATGQVSPLAVEPISFVNGGSFIFERTVLTGVPDVYFLGVLDVDGDRRDDLVMRDASTQARQISVLRNEPSGRFSKLAVDPVEADSVLEGDFDGDGDPDLAAVSIREGVRILLDDQVTSSFRLAGRLPSQSPLGVLLAADFDGDLDPDLAGMEAGAIAVFLNSGTGSFAERRIVAERERTYGDADLVAGRFDADADLDLAMGKGLSVDGGRVLILENRPIPLSLDCDENGIPDECTPGQRAGCDDCDRNGIPDFRDIAEGAPDLNENGVPDGCEGELDFRLRFRAPLALTGSAGTPIRVPASVELLTLGLPKGEPGAEGWTLRIAADGGKLVGATTEGTLAGPPPLGLLSQGFSVIRLPDEKDACDGGTVLNGLVLSLTEPVTLPHAASEILRLELETSPPAEGGVCRLRFQRSCNSRPRPDQGAGAHQEVQIIITWKGDSRGVSIEDHSMRLVPARFVRGDANSDGKVDISDAIRGFMFLFLGASPPLCLDTDDANDDGSVDITDGIHILNDFFREGTGIPAPGPFECGIDPTPDPISCGSYPHCG